MTTIRLSYKEALLKPPPPPPPPPPPIEFPSDIFDQIKIYLLPTKESRKKEIIQEVDEFLSSKYFNEDFGEYTLRWHTRGIRDLKQKIRTALLDDTFIYSAEVWSKSNKIRISKKEIHYYYSGNDHIFDEPIKVYPRYNKTLGIRLVWYIGLFHIE
jgi:hypothetical protein